jgi:uncharacterized membrane protein YtjA (UPF0391 family)
LLFDDEGGPMLKGAAIFLVGGLVAALLGFTTIAGVFLFMFLMLLVVALFAVRTA